jgi:MEMO1 family protein
LSIVNFPDKIYYYLLDFNIMSLVFAAITPHPPIIIPTIGHENLPKVKNTIEAMTKLEKDFREAKPDVVVIISPHGQLFSDAFTINYAESYTGTFEHLGDLSVNLKFNTDLEFLHRLKEKLEDKLPTVIIQESRVDHGSLVPLYFLTKNIKPNIVPIGYSLLDYEKHLEFGRILKEKIVNSQKRVAVIASGDLSHRLTEDAPAGYSPRGKEFDLKLIELLEAKNTKGILAMDKNFIEEAGECGLRSILILLGLMENINYQPELYSYEGPFGVGYCVMNFKI